MIAYTLKGVDLEITKGAKQKIFDAVVSARIAQGELEYLEVSEGEKEEIIRQWYTKVAETQKTKKGKKLQSKDKMGMGEGKATMPDTK